MPPLGPTHHPSILAGKINGHETVVGQRSTNHQQCFLILWQRLDHGFPPASLSPLRPAVRAEFGCLYQRRHILATTIYAPGSREAERAMRENHRTGHEKSMVGPCGLEPQTLPCQPITVRKNNNLDRIEHPLYNRYTAITGKNHR